MEDIGLDYMTSAARQGDLGSVLYLASAYDTGLNLGSDRKVRTGLPESPPPTIFSLTQKKCRNKYRYTVGMNYRYVVDVKKLNK